MRNLLGRIQTAVLLAGIWVTLHAFEAIAQNQDWAKSPSDTIDRIANGLLMVGGSLLGVVICVVGIRYAATQRIEMNNLYAVFFGGILIFGGGAMIKGILEFT